MTKQGRDEELTIPMPRIRPTGIAVTDMSEERTEAWRFRVLVTGSRHATEAQHQHQIREGIVSAIGHIRACDMDRVVLVHGDAPGVDSIAADIVKRLPWPVQVEPHNARVFGSWPAAGPRRNAYMVSLGASICLAFPLPGSRGTWDCASKAADAGIPTIVRSLRRAPPDAPPPGAFSAFVASELHREAQASVALDGETRSLGQEQG